jgi:adenylylsulfate kinase
MIVIQLTGLSGAGKTTIACKVKDELLTSGFAAEVVDGDVYRQTVCKELGFSKEDRQESVRRLGAVAYSLIQQNKIVLIAAINPYEDIRNELKLQYGAKTVWIYCPLEVLISRDPKGLYRKALLPDDHPEKIHNLTGVNDAYEPPEHPDLLIDTSTNDIAAATAMLLQFIMNEVSPLLTLRHPVACTTQNNGTYILEHQP